MNIGHDSLVNRLCQIMNFSPRGPLAWRSRPMSTIQRKNMVVLTYIRDQYEQPLGSYCRPRMAKNLNNLEFALGHRRVGRLRLGTSLHNALPDNG